MSKYRRAARIDENQNEAVKTLRKLGLSVVPQMDDFLVGHAGKTLWVEWKSDKATSKRTGEVLESRIKKSQKKIRDTFTGAYLVTNKVEDILSFFGIKIQ